MASAPQPQMPLLYKELIPLNSRDHGAWHARTVDKAQWVGEQHAIPLTVDEFTQAMRHFPIVFSTGDNPVPLALMGLNEGVNVFFDQEGNPVEDAYIPAYVRRYPFLLAKLQADADEMSLCFDPNSKLLGEFEEGEALFQDGQASDHARSLLDFCQRFEEAGARTRSFVAELLENELLMDGEFAVQLDDRTDKPYIYRGFKMVNQTKLRALEATKVKAWNESGLLSLAYAHLFSLDLIRVIFAKQTAQGKGPGAVHGPSA